MCGASHACIELGIEQPLSLHYAMCLYAGMLLLPDELVLLIMANALSFPQIGQVLGLQFAGWCAEKSPHIKKPVWGFR